MHAEKSKAGKHTGIHTHTHTVAHAHTYRHVSPRTQSGLHIDGHAYICYHRNQVFQRLL